MINQHQDYGTPSAEVTSVVHRQTSQTYGTLDDNVYFPINVRQVRDLIGKTLTQLDAMALPDRPHRAAKSLLVQEFWRWWGDACDNSTTSGAGGLAPVVMNSERPVEGLEPSNRWGWASEQEYLKAHEVRPGTQSA